MTKVDLKSFAKVNIGLQIRGQRPDGFHIIHTLFQELDFHDTLILEVWDDEVPDVSHDNKLQQLVYRLNKKINTLINSDMPLIENSYALGYRIDRYS